MAWPRFKLILGAIYHMRYNHKCHMVWPRSRLKCHLAQVAAHGLGLGTVEMSCDLNAMWHALSLT